MLIRGIYGVVYSTIIIGMFRYIIIIIYEVPTAIFEQAADQRFKEQPGSLPGSRAEVSIILEPDLLRPYFG